MRLQVTDLAVLEHVEAEFGPGLNVVSGETGAGKSLLVDGLHLALGARAGGDLVRTGARAARVTALFAGDARAAAALAEFGAEPDEDGMVLLQREVGADGRSSCRINGRLQTAAALRQVGGSLVAVVGQGDHHRFATPAGQLDFLDAYGGSELLQLRDAVHRLFADWRAAAMRVADAGGSPASREAERQRLSERVAEIDAAAPAEDEEERLSARRQVLAEAERLQGGVARGLLALSEGDDAVRDRLGRVAVDLRALARIAPELSEPLALVEQAAIAAGEAAHTLAGLRERFADDPAALEALEARWGVLQRLKRRYGDSLAAVLAARDEAAAAMEALQQQEASAAAAAAELAAARTALGEAAGRLSVLRREAAERLRAHVGHELADLGMPRADLRIVLSHRDDAAGVPVGEACVACSPTGVDHAEFLWAANPGQAPVALQRSASGGELARLVLALHAMAASQSDLPTVVFDEVDAGVGGRAAAAVAERLRRLGGQRQVLCVTHLAVIAAAADRHLAIEKSEQAGAVGARLRELTGPERTLEVARMLDGGVGEASRTHAAELLRGSGRRRGK